MNIESYIWQKETNEDLPSSWDLVCTDTREVIAGIIATDENTDDALLFLKHPADLEMKISGVFTFHDCTRIAEAHAVQYLQKMTNKTHPITTHVRTH